jgi:hypothetical protein
MVEREQSAAVFAEVTAVLGSRVAWWQLGFRLRQEVARTAAGGRPHPDPVVAEVAAIWARSVLATPWWRWAAGTAGLALLGAAFTAVMINLVIDASPASPADVAALPVAAATVAGAISRARLARRVLAVTAASRTPDAGGTSAWRTTALVVGSCLLAIIGTVIVNAAYRQVAVNGCPPHRVPPEIHHRWLLAAGREGFGCPVADSQPLTGGAGQLVEYAGGDPFGPGSVIVLTPDGSALAMDAPFREAWSAAGGESSFLGYPVSEVMADGDVRYVNFQGGSITIPPGGSPQVLRGVTRPPPEPVSRAACTERDRPCLVVVAVTHDAVRLTWQYGMADAFDITWQGTDGRNGAAEVAGYDYVLANLRPGATYSFSVEACDKHLVGQSTCSRFSDSVTVTTPGR